ncbi:Gfo/Idh/MocA family oxidoreductase [soil metagenome]
MGAPTTGTWRWGIAGTGGIADSFTRDLALVPGAEVVAVGSRARATADAFAARHGIARAHGSYEALAADADVDVVYVASPHTSHLEHTLLFLGVGRHVLCEKPMGVSAAEVRRMVDAAHVADRFLLEAIWSRFLPAYAELRALLSQGVIGEPTLVDAEFGFVMPFDPTHRLFDPALGGGATLDLGIYPIQLGHLVLGTPDQVTAAGHLGASGVDEHVAAVLRHPGGGLTVAKASLTSSLRCTATISGTQGTIELPAFMHQPTSLVVRALGGERVVEAPITGVGLHHEALEVQRCLAAGERESPLLTHGESLAIAASLDAVRAAVGGTPSPG